jgi:hypothetical protein
VKGAHLYKTIQTDGWKKATEIDLFVASPLCPSGVGTTRLEALKVAERFMAEVDDGRDPDIPIIRCSYWLNAVCCILMWRMTLPSLWCIIISCNQNHRRTRAHHLQLPLPGLGQRILHQECLLGPVPGEAAGIGFSIGEGSAYDCPVLVELEESEALPDPSKSLCRPG